MPVPSSNITISSIQTEFGGTAPIGIKEYYNVASGIPSTGIISFSQFAGKSAYSRVLVDTKTGTSVSTSTIPVTVNFIQVIVVGGGGSGACGAYSPPGRIGGAGGGSGGFGLYRFSIPSDWRGGYFVYTVGAGGVAVSNPLVTVGKVTQYDPINGQNGGQSSVQYRRSDGSLAATFTATGGGGGAWTNGPSNAVDNSGRGTPGSFSSSIVVGSIIYSLGYDGGYGGGNYEGAAGSGAGSAFQKYLSPSIDINGSRPETRWGVDGTYGGGFGIGGAAEDGRTVAGSGSSTTNFDGAGGGGVGNGTIQKTSGAGASGRIIIYY